MMLFRFLFTFFFLLIFGNVFSQSTFQKICGGTFLEYGRCGLQTLDGGYAIAGFTNSFGAGNRDIYLARMDEYGNFMWGRTYGSFSDDEGKSFSETNNGGFIIASNSGFNLGAGGGDVLLIRVDSIGDTIWTRTVGGTDSESPWKVNKTANNDYIIVGQTSSFSLNEDIHVVRMSENGDLIWTKSFSGTGSDIGRSIVETSDQGFVITGYTFSYGAGGRDAFILKVDSLGNFQWGKTYGTSSTEGGYSIWQASDKGIYIAGFTDISGFDDILLIKTDSLGNIIWSKKYGTSSKAEFALAMSQTLSGILLTGSYVPVPGGEDVILIKTDINGNLLFSKIFTGSDSEGGQFIDQTSDGGYLISGLSYSFSNGYADMYLIKTDSLGNSGCNESNYPITMSNVSLSVSSFTPTVTSGGVLGYPATQVGSGGSVQTLCYVGMNEQYGENEMQVYPNPSGGNFTVFSETFNGTVFIEVSDLEGRRIFEERTSIYTPKEIRMKNCSPGLYFLRVIDGEKQLVKKIIIH